MTMRNKMCENINKIFVCNKCFKLIDKNHVCKVTHKIEYGIDDYYG